MCIPHMSRTLNLPCGLSDHTKEPVVAIAAVSLGACMIEKHLTLRKDAKGIDGGFSLTPEEFKEMVDSVRIAEKAVGKIVYGPQRSERQSLIFRRSLYAVENIETGQEISNINVRSIRPNGGLPPVILNELLGKITRKDIRKGTPITWEAF